MLLTRRYWEKVSSQFLIVDHVIWDSLLLMCRKSALNSEMHCKDLTDICYLLILRQGLIV